MYDGVISIRRESIGRGGFPFPEKDICFFRWSMLLHLMTDYDIFCL